MKDKKIKNIFTNFQYVDNIDCSICNRILNNNEYKYLDLHDGGMFIYCKDCNENIIRNGIKQ